MKGQKKKYMYPKSDEGRGPASVDFSQAFRSSHLGDALCTSNPLQQKFLEQQVETLDQAKRRREAVLFHYQRNFFIAQVFGKGLNPHLKKSTDGDGDELDSKQSNAENVTPELANAAPVHAPGTQRPSGGGHSEKQPTEETNLKQNGAEGNPSDRSPATGNERVKRSTKPPPMEVIEEGHMEAVTVAPATYDGQVGDNSLMELGREQATRLTGSRTMNMRSHTSGDLRGNRVQSQSLPSLSSASGLRVRIDEKSLPQLKDESSVGFRHQRAKSTNDLGDSTKQPITDPATSVLLPTISKSQKVGRSRPPEAIDEEEEYDVESSSERDAVSVHTTTDHVGISSLKRAMKKDVLSLRKDPSKLFPKMKVLLTAYDEPDSKATFNEIMEIGDHDRCNQEQDVVTQQRWSSLLSRSGSMSARTTADMKKRRVKVKVNSARQASPCRMKCKTAVRQGLPSKPSELKEQLLKRNSNEDISSVKDSASHLVPRPDPSTSNARTTPGEGEVNETQRYVKMIQQLTAYLPEHLLATAEEQIRKMSNTEQIMKFKKKMIEKNQARMRRDLKADPRWRKLEGTLAASGNPGQWHRRHEAWVFY